MARAGRRAPASRRPVAARSCGPRRARHRRMPCAHGSSGARVARASTTCSSAASGSCPACSASTWRPATGHGRIRVAGRAARRRHRRSWRAMPIRYPCCRSWVACPTPIGAPPAVGRRIFSQNSSISALRATTSGARPAAKGPHQGWSSAGRSASSPPWPHATNLLPTPTSPRPVSPPGAPSAANSRPVRRPAAPNAASARTPRPTSPP